MSQITVTRILDGPRNAVFHVSIVGDALGDLVDHPIIDPATDFNPPRPPVPSMRLHRLWYDLSGFTGFLEFDYLSSDTPIWTLSGNGASELDFSWFGGLADRSVEIDGSGKLMLSTSGLGEGGRGSIVVAAVLKD